MQERFKFTTREDWLNLRLDDITSTEISALFGKNPYMSKFELWHSKKNRIIDDFEPSERMEVGAELEDGIARLFSRKHFNSMPCCKVSDYIRIPDLRMGSSFDYAVVDGGDVEHMEIKSVDYFIYKDKWNNGEDAPIHIELQAQHQLIVGGYSVNNICVFVGGNQFPKPLRREVVPFIRDEIIRRVEEFWKSIEEDNPPDPDMYRDSGAIAAMNAYAEVGKVLSEPSEDVRRWALRYKRCSALKSKLEKEMKRAKAELLLRIGDHEKVKGDGFSISAGMIGPKDVSYKREGYRDFRVFVKGKK